MGRRKHCSAQPYLDYIGVSEKERKEMRKATQNGGLGKEGLLAGLSLMKKMCPYITFTWGGHRLEMVQAYTQLKEIVEQHFRDKLIVLGDGAFGVAHGAVEEKDKLLQELAYLDQAEYIDKQAYAQLVKIVEEYFRQPVQVVDNDTILKIFEMYDEPELIGWKIAKVRELLTHLSTNKRTVTMGWVWELKDLFIGYEAGNPISLVLNKLKEQGIEVKEK